MIDHDNPDIVEKLKHGHTAGEKTFRVHIDGYDLLAYLKGETERSPRQGMVYFSDDGDVLALRYDNWKVVTCAWPESAESAGPPDGGSFVQSIVLLPGRSPRKSAYRPRGTLTSTSHGSVTTRSRIRASVGRGGRGHGIPSHRLRSPRLGRALGTRWCPNPDPL